MGQTQRTQVFAHRGSAGTLPENTLMAFEAALTAGADGIETDVQLSRDGRLVIIHDETVDRTTDGTGAVKDLTLAHLRKLDAGDPQRQLSATIPLLDEVVDLLNDRHFTGSLNLELKTNKYPYPGLENRVATYFAQRFRSFKLVFSSFRPQSLITLQRLYPQAEYAQLFQANSHWAKRLLRRHQVAEWHPDIRWVKAHRFWLPRVQLRPWTVNRPADMSYCFRHHFRGIITDYPARAVQLRRHIQGD